MARDGYRRAVIRHIVLSRWKEGVTDDDVTAVRDALNSLPSAIPQIRSYRHGPDLKLGKDSWDYGIVADFDDAEGWRIYDEDAVHARVRSDVVVPRMAERAAVRLALD
jgi:hypothetical protein